MREKYPSDISREEFEEIREDLEGAKKKTHPRDYDLYDIFCAVLYLLKEGCTWRGLQQSTKIGHEKLKNRLWSIGQLDGSGKRIRLTVLLGSQVIEGIGRTLFIEENDIIINLFLNRHVASDMQVHK